MSRPNFDRHQFEHRSFPVNGKNGISFDDAQFMQTQRHKAKPSAWVPPFAMNDSQLQKVLLLRAWLYVGGAGAVANSQTQTASAARKSTGQPRPKPCAAILFVQMHQPSSIKHMRYTKQIRRVEDSYNC